MNGIHDNPHYHRSHFLVIPLCKGKFTWSQRGSKTTIDYILVNEKALESFQDMEIDEDKIMFSDSDHCILSAKFYFKGAEKQSFKKEEWKYFEYYRRDEEALSRYRGEVEREWIEGCIENKQMEEQSLMMKAEEVLKKKTRKRVGAQEYVENVWMTDQIRKEIKVRRIINRRRRNAVGEEEKERLWKSYLRQKWKVQKLIREAKERHELEVTKEIKRKMREGRGGKKLWECMDKLMGRNKRKEEKLEVYDDNGTKMEEEEAANKIKEVFREIYKSNEK